MQPQQARTYHIQLLKKNDREALDGRVFTYILDFSPGPGLLATFGLLNGLVQGLAWKDGARGKDTLYYSLKITDPSDPKNTHVWPATTWHEDTY